MPSIQIVSDQIDQGRLDHLAALLDRERLASGDAVPALWHWLFCIAPVRRSSLGPDGHERLGEFIPSLPASHRMWAGGDIQILQRLRMGDTITRRSHVAKVDHKQGSTGELWFVTIKHDYIRSGEPVLIEDQNLVYSHGASIGRPPVKPPPGDTLLTGKFDDVALQRYSALTLNSHRIHFDRDYCRGAMADERLVVHAPLLATCLADQIENKQAISRFTYRMIAPTREGESVRFGYDRAGNTAFVAGEEGGLRLLAQITIGVPAI